MNKSWRIILVVVLVAILLGCVCAGVGLVTGGDWERIHTTLDMRYHLDMYWDYIQEVVRVLHDAWVAPVV